MGGWVTGLAVYVVVWWIVLFTVLPWGAAPPDQPAQGHATSAPANPRMWLKAGVTTVVAAIVWLGIYWLVSSDLISFRRMVG
jgi:predicted secreted protein